MENPALHVIVRIANAAGFLGDNLDAPRRLVESAQVDYLTLEYLAELTMSILANLREKDPEAGYARDFLTVLRSLVPALEAQEQLRMVTNGGGVNPLSCAAAAGAILKEAGVGDVAVGVVTGDDIRPRLAELRAAGCKFENLDTHEPLSSLAAPIVSANAYLGAQPIAEALAGGARIVVTGRVADASLTVGPAVHTFGWKWDDYQRLAGASVAGHLIECGAQVTGGFYTHWDEVDLAAVGYPIAEIDEQGHCVITKPAGSGGRVSRETVCEQLVYEIGDGAHYLTPDVDVDFTQVTAEEIGPDRVAVRGARGGPRPETLKVSLAYRAGFTASMQVLCYGKGAVDKARRCAEIVRRRLEDAGCKLARFHAECLGAGEAVPGLNARPDAEEVVLRLSAADPRREAVERFTRELAPLATAGPAGLAGYAAGRAPVREVFAYWPTLVPRDAVSTKVDVRKAREW
ncbi:MAG: DUF1446 domain-containing protein [Planctomycetia bacterium]|nr:DUF1446 domain-containing protein [Planctomycetia bacterium]